MDLELKQPVFNFLFRKLKQKWSSKRIDVHVGLEIQLSKPGI